MQDFVAVQDAILWSIHGLICLCDCHPLLCLCHRVHHFQQRGKGPLWRMSSCVLVSFRGHSNIVATASFPRSSPHSRKARRPHLPLLISTIAFLALAVTAVCVFAS